MTDEIQPLRFKVDGKKMDEELDPEINALIKNGGEYVRSGDSTIGTIHRSLNVFECIAVFFILCFIVVMCVLFRGEPDLVDAFRWLVYSETNSPYNMGPIQ